MRLVLVFFPVPPSLRQAAGPLTENLPNVSVGDPGVLGIDLLLERPSPRGTKRRLSLSGLAPSLLERLGFTVTEPQCIILARRSN
jgi:hypothetical protein